MGEAKWAEPLDVTKEELMEMLPNTMRAGLEYLIVEKKDRHNVTGFPEISLKRTAAGVTIIFRASGSAKYWGGLFTLESTLEAHKEAALSMKSEGVKVISFDTEEVNHMELCYALKTPKGKAMKEILELAEKTATEVEQKGLEILVAKANGLLKKD